MPIALSAVKFADGTEKGDKETLDSMHKVIEHDKAEKAKKGGQP